MKRLLRLAALLTAAILAAAPSNATVGGPEIAEALDWDPVERKAFFTIDPMDESDRMTRVLYFTSGGSPLGYVVGWSQAAYGDSAYARGFRALRKRLRPLPYHPAPTIPVERRILEADTVDVGGTRWPRFRVRARGPQSVGNGVLEVTTIGDPDVRVVRRYLAPGNLQIGIVSFRGIPTEAGYEVQIPVLLPGQGDTLRIEWKAGR